jgi:hypothetical protein
MYIGIHVKYPLFLSDFNETRILSTDFRKILISHLMKIRVVGAELFHEGGRTDRQTDRQTDMTKLIVGFGNFSNASKNNYWKTKSVRRVGLPLRTRVG